MKPHDPDAIETAGVRRQGAVRRAGGQPDWLALDPVGGDRYLDLMVGDHGDGRTAATPYLVVLRRSGPLWDPSRSLEQQDDWPAHAAFMDGLVDSGFVILGGPLADEHRVVLIVEAESEEAVRATLASDPWSEDLLRIDTIDRWTIRLDGLRPVGQSPEPLLPDP
jgi:hypothetical protein